MKPFGHFAAELAQLGGIPAEDPRRRDFPNLRDRLELGARLAARADESDPSWRQLARDIAWRPH